eukprot:CAMPEP_0201507778 /NCGR_PEP_ID=MMETSP0161_2-20130828/1343_1 /ASSEMBLY_ACC=CAM_ASM_000251 /TAXON_ID=180227 /ORGANISM="Neoparamoeba aestuarina, Strain SoJaBio B1-5/56/2" /LENGTH=344 /DNA_ID=CAMNT_0047902243 /DNA_START=34 /DNA_END=1068 /DNA_ORIENTATION=-
MIGREVILRGLGSGLRRMKVAPTSGRLRTNRKSSFLLPSSSVSSSFSPNPLGKRSFQTLLTCAERERTSERMGMGMFVVGSVVAGCAGGLLLGKKKVLAEELFGSSSIGSEMYENADKLYEHEKHDEAIDILQEMIELVPDNNDALWRLSRTLCGKSELSQSNSAKKELLERAIKAARDSLDIEETYESHKWLGIALFLAAQCYWWPGWMATMEEAKDHLQKAAEREEQYQVTACQIETHLFWGKWNYEAAAGNTSFWHLMSYLSWSNVPEGNLDTALSCFLEVEGAMVHHNKYEMEATLYLVKTYLQMGDKEKSKFWLNQGAQCKKKRGKDVEVATEMKQIRV